MINSNNNTFSTRNLIFVLAIPIINAIATLTVNYFEAASFNPGTVRAAIIGIFILLVIFKQSQRFKINTVIILYLIFLFFLVLLSSNISLSLYNYVKLVLALMMYPIGLYFFKEFNDLVKLNLVIVISISLFVLNLLISNFFQLGTSDYLENSVFFGSGRVNIAKSVAIMIVSTPIFFLHYKPKHRLYYYLSILVVFGGLLLVFIAVKRSALFALVVGSTLYLLLSPKKIKKIQFLIVIGILAVVFSNIYLDKVTARFQAREERFEFSDPEFKEEENRFREFSMVISDIKTRDPIRLLIGTELFNDREYYQQRRMLHTDYMILLHGSGIIGFLWFYLIYFLIFRRIHQYCRVIKQNWAKELQAISLALIVASLILSIAGTIYTVEILSILFLYIGASTGVLRQAYINIRREHIELRNH